MVRVPIQVLNLQVSVLKMQLAAKEAALAQLEMLAITAAESAEQSSALRTELARKTHQLAHVHDKVGRAFPTPHSGYTRLGTSDSRRNSWCSQDPRHANRSYSADKGGKRGRSDRWDRTNMAFDQQAVRQAVPLGLQSSITSRNLHEKAL